MESYSGGVVFVFRGDAGVSGVFDVEEEVKKARILALLGLVLVAAALAAYFAISNIGRKAEEDASIAIRQPTSTKMVEACAKSPSEPRSASSRPTPKTFSGPITSTARPFDEIQAELLARNVEYVDTKLPFVETSEKILAKWSSELYGKRIPATKAWILATGNEVMNSLEMTNDSRFNKHSFSGDFSDAILLTLVNPFISNTASYTIPWGIRDDVRPKIVLVHAKEATGRQLCIGQEISFEGEVRWDPAELYGGSFSNATELPVPNADVTILDDSGSGSKLVREDISDIYVSLFHSVGFDVSIPISVDLYGNGLVIFSGYSKKEHGYPTRIATISEDKVRRILGEFDKANFQTLTGYGAPKDAVETHQPSTILILIEEGKTKRVSHYMGTKEAPERLYNLEESLYNLFDVDQWIGLCGSDGEALAPYPCK